MFGYRDSTIFISVILEYITICFTAVLTGLFFTAILIPATESMSGGLMDDVISSDFGVILGGFLIGLIIALCASVPAYNALNLKVVDALRAG